MTRFTDLSVGQSVLVDRSLPGKVVALVPGYRIGGWHGKKTVRECWMAANPGQLEMLKSQRTFDSFDDVPHHDSAIVEIPPPEHSGRRPAYKLVTMGRITTEPLLLRRA